MERLNQYRRIVKQIVLRNAEYEPSVGQIETLPIFDEARDHYFLIDYGWNRTGRVHSVILHLRISNGKVWIERDGTEAGVADDLVASGIPHDDIVLGFYRPERRAITDFAVA